MTTGEQEKKLIEILKTNEIRISTRGRICLNDFVDNVIGSKNAKLYMKKITNKKLLNDDNYYIKPIDCLEILKQGKSKKCKEIVQYVEKDDNDNRSIIDPVENIFQYDGHKFLAFFIDEEDDEWQVWVKGSNVTSFLSYGNRKQAIIEHVESQNKMRFDKLQELLTSLQIRSSKNIDKKTIFINLSGFFNLIHHSKKPFAKKMKSWIDNEVLPALVKHGSYHMQPKKIDIKLFYDDVAISTFFGKAVIYIGFIGRISNEYLFKYGLSRNVFERDYNQHSKKFDMFQVVYIGETDNCEQIETLFENDLKIFGLHRQRTINRKSQTELFTVSTKHSIEFLINHLKSLIINFKLPAIKDANNQIVTLNNVLDTYKQSDEIKKLELQFWLSDNYKLKHETELKMKQIDTDANIALTKLDIMRQREITKQLQIKMKMKRLTLKQCDDTEDSESSSDKIVQIKNQYTTVNNKKCRNNIIKL
jgi:prophage antirepressor-like protein